MKTATNPTAVAINRLRTICNKPISCYLFWVKDVRLLLNSHSEALEHIKALEVANEAMKQEIKVLKSS